MSKMTIIDCKNEISRYIYAIHLAKILAKKKMQILILDCNQISKFLNFPNITCTLKSIMNEEPYKIKINTITNKTDLLKLPSEIFFKASEDSKIINSFKVLMDYLLEKYDHIICTSFIIENKIIEEIFNKSLFIFDINKIDSIEEDEIINKVNKINNKKNIYRLVLESFDKTNNLYIKFFLNLKKIFEKNLINQNVYIQNYKFDISFINPKIYNKETINNISSLLEEINFYKSII